MPIFNYADGYGLTYGARTTFSGVGGPRRQAVGAVVVGRRASRGRGARTHRSSRARCRWFAARYSSTGASTRTTTFRTCGWAFGSGPSAHVTRGCGPPPMVALERVDFAGVGGARHSAVGRPPDASTRASTRRFRETPYCTQFGWERVAFPSRPRRPRAARRTRLRGSRRARRCWRSGRRPRAPMPRCRPPNSRCSVAAGRCAATARVIAPATAWPRYRPRFACRSTRRSRSAASA